MRLVLVTVALVSKRASLLAKKKDQFHSISIGAVREVTTLLLQPDKVLPVLEMQDMSLLELRDTCFRLKSQERFHFTFIGVSREATTLLPQLEMALETLGLQVMFAPELRDMLTQQVVAE
jgi:hypothetical protein